MWRLFPYLRWLWAVILLGVLLGLAANIITAVLQTGHFKPSQEALDLLRQYRLTLLITSAVLFLLTCVAWRAHLRRLRVDGPHVVAPMPWTTQVAPDQRRRRQVVLLEKVESFWVKGVLERSINGVALINLGKETRPEAVQHPWEMVLDARGRRESLPTDTRMIDVFDGLAGCLLVLGEPGSGKTTSLLELGRDLIAHARKGPDHPIPVVFNLSSWSQNRSPIELWLTSELDSKYRIPRHHAQDWIARDDLILLLDGLDEVRPEHQAACVAAINIFRQNYGLTRIAVCCRSDDYNLIGSRLHFEGAIHLLPLTVSQVHEYLEAGGDLLRSLQSAVRRDRALLTLARRPLMLAIMTLAYSGKSLTHILSQSHSLSLNELFADYVTAMFERLARTKNERFSRSSTIKWLSCLASQLLLHSQTQFLIEDIQASWLRSERYRRLFQLIYMFACATLFGAPVGLTWGLAARLVLKWNQALSTLTFGLPSAAAVCLAVRREFGWKGRLLVGVTYGTLMTITSAGKYGARIAVVVGTLGGIVAGLGFGLVLGRMHSRKYTSSSRAQFTLITVDKLSWSWRSAVKGLVSYGIPVGLATCFVIGVAAVLTAPVSTGLMFATVAGTVVMCTCGVLLGLTCLEIEKKPRPGNLWVT